MRTLASSSFFDCFLELSAETAFTPVNECAPKRLAERLLLASHSFCRYGNRSGTHREICADAKEILNNIPTGVRFSKTEAQTAIVRVTLSFAVTFCASIFECCGVGRKQSQPSIKLYSGGSANLRVVKRKTTSANDLFKVDSKLHTCAQTDVPTFASRRVVDAIVGRCDHANGLFLARK